MTTPRMATRARGEWTGGVIEDASCMRLDARVNPSLQIFGERVAGARAYDRCQVQVPGTGLPRSGLQPTEPVSSAAARSSVPGTGTGHRSSSGSVSRGS